jgi:hypothetical protein
MAGMDKVADLDTMSDEEVEEALSNEPQQKPQPQPKRIARPLPTRTAVEQKPPVESRYKYFAQRERIGLVDKYNNGIIEDLWKTMELILNKLDNIERNLGVGE